MQEKTNIIDCYNRTAKNYAAKFKDELDEKHLDRILLKSFATENMNSGKLIDLGCGPGQTTKFLSGCGMQDTLGVDISPSMVKIANELHPHLVFETGDILKLKYPDKSFGSAVAFYAIVHFNYEQVKEAFKEISRILTESGQFLFSFHIGDKVVHYDKLLDQDVNIDFYFFETNKICALLTGTGFEIIDAIERDPYQNAEFPSRRAYIWAKKTRTLLRPDDLARSDHEFN